MTDRILIESRTLLTPKDAREVLRRIQERLNRSDQPLPKEKVAELEATAKRILNRQ